MAEEKEEESLEYTSTWRLASVCFFFVITSLFIATAIHKLGKFFKRRKLKSFHVSLEKIKEELMIIGFISLFLAAFQGPISHICIPKHSTETLLPCGNNVEEDFSIEGVALKVGHCEKKGKEPFLSIEGLHQLHIFIFVLAITHIIFCVTTMLLAYIKIRSWKRWEPTIENKKKKTEIKEKEKDLNEIRDETSVKTKKKRYFDVIRHSFIKKHAPKEMSFIMSWVVSFFKQFWGSVNNSDYSTIRLGFIKHIGRKVTTYNFYEYMIRTLEEDFIKIVGIRWYLWMYVIIFLLLNNHGWHMYFYISFIPLINAFEIAFFFWVWTTFGFRSCIMGKVGYVVPRLAIGLIVQVLCSYSTLPLYAVVIQMVSEHKMTLLFSERIREDIMTWYERSKRRIERRNESKKRIERRNESIVKDIEMA